MCASGRNTLKNVICFKSNNKKLWTHICKASSKAINSCKFLGRVDGNGVEEKMVNVAMGFIVAILLFFNINLMYSRYVASDDGSLTLKRFTGENFSFLLLKSLLLH